MESRGAWPCHDPAASVSWAFGVKEETYLLAGKFRSLSSSSWQCTSGAYLHVLESWCYFMLVDQFVQLLSWACRSPRVWGHWHKPQLSPAACNSRNGLARLLIWVEIHFGALMLATAFLGMQESMRLWSVALGTTRQLEKATSTDGYGLAAGSQIRLLGGTKRWGNVWDDFPGHAGVHEVVASGTGHHQAAGEGCLHWRL